MSATTETATTETAVRELDRRINDGFDVRLLWDPRTDRVFVSVEDQREGETFELGVDPAHAVEAFHHPFAFAGTTRTSRMSVCLPAGSEEMRNDDQ